MGLLDANEWVGKIYVRGVWAEGDGGTAAVVEPATGEELTRVGMASPKDVHAAANSAAAAQREWAARPHAELAAVLRRAGDLFAGYADEISTWKQGPR